MHPPPAHSLHNITESSAIAAVRRSASQLAGTLGMDETTIGRLSIVVTEAATNILKHASEGKILLRSVEAPAMISRAEAGGDAPQPVVKGEPIRGIEIIAIDNGPGISDVAFNMLDGSSSAGSYGVGLGAMQRLANEFDLYSLAGNGCAVWMVVWADATYIERTHWQVGAVCVPLAGETACGDSWIAAQVDEELLLMVADGLGHGPHAAEASQAAVDVVWNDPMLGPGAVIDQAHGALRGTRGAAVGVARICGRTEELQFAGIGNIAGSIEFDVRDHDGSPRSQRAHLISHNGIVGNAMRRAQEFCSPWRPGATLLLHSDGVATKWDLNRYPGLAVRHPALVAAMLYRDFVRERDDATIVVVRQRPRNLLPDASDPAPLP